MAEIIAAYGEVASKSTNFSIVEFGADFSYVTITKGGLKLATSLLFVDVANAGYRASTTIKYGVVRRIKSPRGACYNNDHPVIAQLPLKCLLRFPRN